MKRYIEPYIYQDVKKKMVFMGGPRQAGKTTLAKALLKSHFTDGEYFNWDIDEDREAILDKRWREDSPLITFDELHKYPRWKQWIKGVYDSRPNDQQYMVTGSARLDTYRRGGDSLMGRYHYWRLHPITIDELPKDISTKTGLERLMTLGGFPEPFLQNDMREARRWRRERFDRIINEDVRDLAPIRELQLLRLFIDALRKRAGSLITLSNLAADLQISPNTAKNWISIIERLYIGFAIYPLQKNIERAIQKPLKFYFYDNADTDADEGMRFENLIATTLLKRLHFIEDYEGRDAKLYYLRDKDGREVDFVTVIDNNIDALIEVKLSETTPTTSLKYYARKLKPKKTVQIVYELKRPFDKDGIRVTSVSEYFKSPLWSN
jgi:predicted AAA+ superfamily ATPase